MLMHWITTLSAMLQDDASLLQCIVQSGGNSVGKSVVAAFLFQVPAGVSFGAPSSSSSTLDTVDPGPEDYCAPINKLGLTCHRALQVMCL